MVLHFQNDYSSMPFWPFFGNFPMSWPSCRFSHQQFSVPCLRPALISFSSPSQHDCRVWEENEEPIKEDAYNRCYTVRLKKKTRIFDLQTHSIQKKSFSKYKTEKPKRIKFMFQTFLKNK